MKLGKLWLTQECGQRWYRLSSWRGVKLITIFRDHDGQHEGLSFGPIMLFWRGWYA